MMRAAGSFAIVSRKADNNKVVIQMPNKKEVTLSGYCRVTIGEVAGAGKTLKPFVTAGKKYYKMAATGKLWPRTSAIKVNAIDHPFGSGRGKRAKPKIAKRNAPAGRRVGHIRPRRTGKVK
jgi:large subunit ribosomal protein L2